MNDLSDRPLENLLNLARKKGIIDDYEIDSKVNIRMGALDLSLEEDLARLFIQNVIEEYEQARGGDGGRRRWS